MEEKISSKTDYSNLLGMGAGGILDGLRLQLPVAGLPGARIENVRAQSEPTFDGAFDLVSGRSRIPVVAAIRPEFSPRQLSEIAPWIRRLQALDGRDTIALVTPSLSRQSQAFCVQNGIGFLDLTGNVFITAPGKFTLQRVGMRNRRNVSPTPLAPRLDVFSGRTSRLLRVLLQTPGEWTAKALSDELACESRRLAQAVPGWRIDLAISKGTISKAVSSLEAQLYIRKRGNRILVPEPERLLLRWAEKYKDRYRWRLRNTIAISNPIGTDAVALAGALAASVGAPFAFTGAAAVANIAPWADPGTVDLFVADAADLAAVNGPLIEAGAAAARDPESTLRLTVPYDPGVFLYARQRGAALLVSPVQAFLDLYAQGGRDLKQAEVLLDRVIRPGWERRDS